jgi:hypothetical protein
VNEMKVQIYSHCANTIATYPIWHPWIDSKIGAETSTLTCREKAQTPEMPPTVLSIRDRGMHLFKKSKEVGMQNVHRPRGLV